MKRAITAAILSVWLAWPVQAVVFVNEVSINPPGSLDDSSEFIELCGTPGKKLDGYALVFVSGGQQKYYTLNTIGVGAGKFIPDMPEIDEFMSLDGLTLGPNGILVVAINTESNFPSLLPDSAFQRWTSLWNGGLDTPGKLQNDGSNTVLLIRNRPGRTQADPTNPAGLRWGKDIDNDREVFRPVVDPQDGINKDQYGDGNFDKGQPNNIDGNTLDLKGASTPEDISDDLEVVDEVSYEHDRGWEYDVDGRHIDSGSTHNGLPYRHVHALDDPQGFNPDALTRVDYRTKGIGWTPAPGATGEMGNGNNWQDAATEQWIRGELIVGFDFETIYYDNTANANPDAIQPYVTNVPRWLADGVGTDYSFDAEFYPLTAGQVNPLAITFIPGDADRDGDCDADDLVKIAAVLGDDNWIFSNSFAEAPETDEGDPAAQTRPWDVDATGDNGIEPSDLQWALNFQGDTTGRIVGWRYDSTTRTPLGSGVALNPSATDGNPNPGNNTVGCTVTFTLTPPAGRTLSTLKVGDEVTMIVSGQVASGAIATAGQENGIMQFVQDVALANTGVLRVRSIEALAPYATTRTSIQTLQGTNGDAGVNSINGYTASFTQGLAAAAPLYEVVLQAKSIGSTDVTVTPASLAKFAAGTPQGLKIGHSNNNGNPGSAAYAAAQSVMVATTLAADADADGDVDSDDLDAMFLCDSGPAIAYVGGCGVWDFDGDNDVDSDDYGTFQRCFTGAGGTPEPACDE